ncbi:MAG: hypothetical protein HW406_1354 [Candidatus Brocadiaceae bacterium]|nr:hypothetical protein [Candidatus Brocadiaceae bacterium]
MCNLVELVFYGIVNLLFAVAVDIAPHGRYAIDIFLAVSVFKENTASFLNNQGRFFDVILHLGKRMPQILFVPGL